MVKSCHRMKIAIFCVQECAYVCVCVCVCESYTIRKGSKHCNTFVIVAAAGFHSVCSNFILYWRKKPMCFSCGEAAAERKENNFILIFNVRVFVAFITTLYKYHNICFTIRTSVCTVGFELLLLQFFFHFQSVCT